MSIKEKLAKNGIGNTGDTDEPVKTKTKKDLSKEVKAELWRRGNIDYMYHPIQKIFRKTIDEAPKDVTIIMNECARQLGKSAFGVLWGIEQCLKRPGITVLLAAPNKLQGYEIADGLFDELTKDAPEGLIRKSSTRLRWNIGKSKFVIGGAMNPETLRGVRADDVILEEPRDIESVKLEKFIRGTIMPKLLHRGGRVIVNTTTPESIDHYVVTNLAERAIQSNAYHRFTIYDNPMLTEEKLQFAIRESGGEESIWFRREYMCERVTDLSKLVIPSYSKAANVTRFDGIRPGTTWISGDVGGSRDKTVVHLWGISSITSKPTIVRELVWDNNTPTTIIGKAIVQLASEHECHRSNRWIDAHGQTLVDLNNTTNCSLRLPPKQDVESAIKALNAAFYNKEIEIHESCEFTLRTLRNGYWNDKGTDFLRTEDLGHLDALMSLVYGYRVRNLAYKNMDVKELPDLLAANQIKRYNNYSNVSLAPKVGHGLKWTSPSSKLQKSQ